MLDQSEIEQWLSAGHELRRFEVKGPGELNDKAYAATVARAVMAMANTRDGGFVLLGVGDGDLPSMGPGLTGSQLEDWTDHDNVQDAINRYCDPSVNFSAYGLRLSNGNDVVVLDVNEFESVPHVCAKDYPTIIRLGQTYVRPHGKPESIVVPTSHDMRELLDLAITKGVRDFIRRATGSGLDLNPGTENNKFDVEATELWSSSDPVIDYINEHAYFDISVRPGPYDPSRVPVQTLEQFIREHVVSKRGWPVPYVGVREPFLRHGTWLGQNIPVETVPHCEAWRTATSGQFVHRRVLATDLHANYPGMDVTDPNATGAVALWDPLLYLVEICELAARIAISTGCSTVEITVALHNIAGRQLIPGEQGRFFSGTHTIAAESLTATQSVNSADLIADPVAVALDLTEKLIRPFGKPIARHVLDEWQAKVFNR